MSNIFDKKVKYDYKCIKFYKIYIKSVDKYTAYIYNDFCLPNINR